MQQQLDMAAQPRAERGKNAARRLRAAGKVPAILYGLGKDSVAVSLDGKEITRLLQSPSGHNQILNLKVSGGETAPVMASDWQVDPVRGHLLHVDMRRIDLSQPVEVNVSIHIIGVSQGTREQGGHDEVVNREVAVRALPMDVPEKIEVDVTAMALGESIRVENLAEPDQCSFLSRPEMLLVHCVTPKVAEEEEPEEEIVEEEAAEPAGDEKGPEE
ncbi:MAG: 50S ribosomal protein L25 [Acidobacteriia bacterium]|nr:50S ribosomal protein L25 [Terriglobia bacterium]